MCAGFTAEEEDLFFETSAALGRRLGRTATPAEMLGVIRQAFQGFDLAYATAPAAAKASVACRAGCGTCCHEAVGAQAHEVLIAAEFIQTHFSPAELAGVIVRAAAHRAAWAECASGAAPAPRTPCVLLREGCCSVYAARPESCRAHHSRNLAGCEANLAAGAPLVAVTIPALRGRMFAVMLGLDQAVEAAGFDDRAYNFGSALHEALTDSLCAIRWTRRQAAFSDAALEL